MAQQVDDLTLVATAAAELGLTVDATVTTVLERLIRVASDAIVKHCDRPLHYAAAAVEKLKGHGQPRLVLNRTPLVSVGSIAIDGGEVDADDYSLEDTEAGFIFRESGWQNTGQVSPGISQDFLAGTEEAVVVVTFAGGYVTPYQASSLALTRTLPYDVEQACLETVTALYRRRGMDPTIASESMGDASVSYFGTNTAIGRRGGVIPDTALALLAPYCRAP